MIHQNILEGDQSREEGGGEDEEVVGERGEGGEGGEGREVEEGANDRALKDKRGNDVR